MSTIVRKGVIRGGQVVVEEPINLPDGSEVTITGVAHGKFLSEDDNDRPPTPQEIATALAAMEKIEPFDMTNEERTEVEAWERKVNDYTIANMDKGIGDLFQ
jgi:hypothetical protein